jgi:peptidoglycan/LPS O-acetylase OafA/YrhL
MTNTHIAPSLHVKSASVQLSYKELDILHSLRGFCAFYVVIFHAKYILWSGGSSYLLAIPRSTWTIKNYFVFALDIASSAGYEMVIFFFVLSGFFIRYAQLRKQRPAGKFYLNRILRIYPPYLASVLLAGLVLAYVANYHPQLLTTSIGRELNAGLLHAWQAIHPLTFSTVGQTLLFLRPGENFFGYNNVYWSLLPEALFYLLVPLAFWKPKYYYALSGAAYVFGLAAPIMQLPSSVWSDFLFSYNSYFALGMALYDLVSHRSNWLNAFRRVNGKWLVMTLPSLLLLLIIVAAFHIRSVSGPLSAMLAVVSISTLLAGRISRQNVLVRAFHEVGVFSFSLYLYHFPMLILCYAALVSYTGVMVNYDHYYWVLLPVVTVGCYMLYYVTERLAVKYFRQV